MKQEVILATTHIDLQNEQFTRHALDQMNEIINGATKPLVTYDHDAAIPPVGKVLESRVELRDDGEFQLVATQEFFDKVEWWILEDGTQLFKQESDTDRHPFTNKYEKVFEEFALSFDPVNFESKHAAHSCIKEIEEHCQTKFEVGVHGRKSWKPDPEFIIQFSKIIAGYLVFKNIADKVGDKVADLMAEDAVRFYSFVRSVVLKAAKYAVPSGRPITYIFVVPSDPRIEFVARSTDPDFVCNSLLLEKLDSALSNARYFEQTFGAVRIQYLLNEKGEWRFNYLLTGNGAVIGTKRSFERRSRRIELMVKQIDSTDQSQLSH